MIVTRKDIPHRASGQFAGFIGLLLLVTFLGAAVFITIEAGHDCCGQDCPICACIEQWENNIRQMGTGTIIHLSITVVPLLVLLPVLFINCSRSASTLAALKIRLND